jgi:hypothetical protein
MDVQRFSQNPTQQLMHSGLQASRSAGSVADVVLEENGGASMPVTAC